MTEDIKIFVCTKGKKCPKRGSEGVCEALVAAATDLGCAGNVTVKETKCLDLCKKGPALVIMPAKVKYGRVTIADAREIVSNHTSGDGEPIKRLRLKKKKKKK